MVVFIVLSRSACYGVENFDTVKIKENAIALLKEELKKKRKTGLPFITDTDENIMGIVQQAKKNGAKFVYPAFGVTLRDTQRAYFYEQLNIYFPGLKSKYISSFGDKYSCGSPNAKKLYALFVRECENSGILYKMSDIVKAYKGNVKPMQLSFFD